MAQVPGIRDLSNEDLAQIETTIDQLHASIGRAGTDAAELVLLLTRIGPLRFSAMTGFPLASSALLLALACYGHGSWVAREAKAVSPEELEAI